MLCNAQNRTGQTVFSKVDKTSVKYNNFRLFSKKLLMLTCAFMNQLGTRRKQTIPTT